MPTRRLSNPKRFHSSLVKNRKRVTTKTLIVVPHHPKAASLRFLIEAENLQGLQAAAHPPRLKAAHLSHQRAASLRREVSL